MSSPQNLFYSYCHFDKEHREALEKHLAMLVRNGVVNQWHDGDIVAGRNWEADIKENLTNADIVVFLITSNWLASEACIKEWKMAKELLEQQPNKVLIPVISAECAWLDFDDMKSKLVLPHDGKPVSKWDSEDEAWSNVYRGIKRAAEEQKKTLNYFLTL